MALQLLETEPYEDLLLYFSRVILQADTEDELLWRVARECIGKLGFADCVLYELSEGYLIQKAAVGPKASGQYTIQNPVRIPLGQGITGAVAASGKPEIVGDTAADPRYIVDDMPRLSEICVPICMDSAVYGVIDCEFPEKDYFNGQHLRILTAIANFCAVKIKNIRTQQELMQEQSRLVQLRQEMVELKLRSISTQLNPHFVFNALNAIQYFITTGNKKLSMEYLSLFSRLIRFYLKHLDRETVELAEEIQMLHCYLRLQKLRYDNRFDYEIHMNGSTACKGAVIPVFILQTLFENTIETSLPQQKEPYRLHIQFTTSGKWVTVEVTYCCNFNLGHHLKYRPEYRERLMRWQDQVRLLNRVKNYGIKKSIKAAMPSDRKTNFSTICLQLPNLS
ncbi:histidine kinase [Robiginitalea marina]|uniref:Histidine kinase n=1 Tax=Robiginitalea marina TaxID=2954105 RepID=A0ABT1ATI8_9FLAO|nr:histidine kinase [Robiginitalea marina]MCO5723250.1 histidine kinase [Robiginitalea marina]